MSGRTSGEQERIVAGCSCRVLVVSLDTHSRGTLLQKQVGMTAVKPRLEINQCDAFVRASTITPFKSSSSITIATTHSSRNAPLLSR